MEIGAQLYTLREFCKTPADFAETLRRLRTSSPADRISFTSHKALIANAVASSSSPAHISTFFHLPARTPRAVFSFSSADQPRKLQNDLLSRRGVCIAAY